MIRFEQLSKLYEEGVTAHELRLVFVDDSSHHISDVDGKIENPYLELRRSEIESAYRSIPSHYEVNLLQIGCARDVLDEAERYAKEALTRGQYVGLGYSSPSESSSSIVPQSHWHFMTIDFDNNAAAGGNLDYVGLKFLVWDELSDEEQQTLKRRVAEVRTADKIPQDTGSLEAFNAKAWSDITLRFLKDHFIEVSGPDRKIKVSLDYLELMNKTEAKPNKSFELLIMMAHRRKVSSSKKHQVSKLRTLLKSKFNLPGDPFQLEEQRGYVPNFKVIDDRKAADERAKRDVIRVPFDDNNIVHVGDTNDLERYTHDDDPVNRDGFEKDYYDEDDEAGAFLRDRDD